MVLLVYIVHGCHHGGISIAILSPREVNDFRRSWVDHERWTAILLGSSMLPSVFFAAQCSDEEDYIETQETVRNIMANCQNDEGCRFRYRWRYQFPDEDLQVLDSIVWAPV